MDKRGQVTIFVIIGLVLVISASLVMYVTSREISLETEARRGVGSDVLPVYDFVVECSRQLGKEALIILGQQGGFIDVPPQIARTKPSYLSPDGEGIMKIPFWYFDGEDRSPDIPFMQNEIKKYLAENMPACLNNFSAFRNSHIIQEKSPMTFSVTFTKKKVIFQTRYELDITINAQTTTIDEFISELNVELAGIIDLAYAFMIAENEGQYLENTTIELMSINANIPLNGLEIECGSQSWHLNDIKTELQEMLKFNLPTVRIKNTNYPPFIEDLKVYKRLDDFTLEDIFEGRTPDVVPFDSFEYLKLFWDVGAAKSDLEATVIYEPHFGMDLNGYPNDNGVLATKLIKGAQKYLSFLCMNFHHFTYDIIYPVKFVIKDNSAFNGEGYVFQFAFPVLIDNNEGNRQNFGLKVFKGFDQNLGFCDDLSGPIVEIIVEGISEFGAESLADVNVSLSCFTKSCYLGPTGPSFVGDFGTNKLVTPLPLGCTNPMIRAQKSGYLSSAGQLLGESLKLQMKKLVPFEVKVMKHPYLINDEIWLPPEELRANEFASVGIEMLGTTNSEYVLYPGNDTVFVNLVDGTQSYRVNVLLTLFGNLIGGYTNENLTVTFDELDGRNTIVFNVFEARPTVRNEEYTTKTALFMYEGNLSNLDPVFE